MSNDVKMRGRAAIVGVADLVSPTGELEGTNRQLEANAIHLALEDAGLRPADVDGICSAFGLGWGPSIELSEYLGIRPSWTDSTNIGGASFEAFVEHAAAAIALELCEVVVISYAATPRSGRKRGGAGFGERQLPAGVSPAAEWEQSFGLRLPVGAYALAANRHMSTYGTTSEQLAEIAVSTRQWAARNPNAYLRSPVTVDDVVGSPMEAAPLHKLECCLVTDGAGAVVLTSSDRAKDLRSAAVHVLGAGTSHSHLTITQMPDLTVTPGAVSGAKAFAMAGIKPDDVDVLELYDSFTITVLLALEDLGFCAKGEGGSFVEGGRLGPAGSHPANTTGGGLCYTHPGAFGIFLLVEAVRQLRGECGERQVPSAELAVAHGCGGFLSATSTVVLGTEATL